MTQCEECGDEVSMPYECNRCGNQYCSNHRLPEKHSCEMLDRGGGDSQMIVEVQKQHKDAGSSRLQRVMDRVKSAIPDSLAKRFDGRMTEVFGVTMLVVYFLQFVALFAGGVQLHNTLFVLEPEKVTHLWTWVTSIFAHNPSSLFHIIGNGIILYFFGTLLEKIIGTERYIEIFFGAGILAGLSQIALGIAVNDPTGVLGMSGALMGVLGVLTVYKPNMKVYLYFFIPLPLWLVTAGFVGISVFGIVNSSVAYLGGVAHVAHLIGLVVGLLYGYRTKDQYDIASKIDLISEPKL